MSINFNSFYEANKSELSVLFSNLPDFQIENPSISGTSVKGSIVVSNLNFLDIPVKIPEMLPSTAIDVTITANPKTKSITFLFQPDSFSISFSTQEKLKVQDPSFSITTTVTKPYAVNYLTKGLVPINLNYNNTTLNAQVSIDFKTKDKALTSADVGLVLQPIPPLTLPSVLSKLISLNQVSLEMGMLFQPMEQCLLGIGADAVINLPTFPAVTDDFMIVCVLEGDVLVPYYISFSTNKLSLNALASYLLGGTFFGFMEINLIQPSFAWCDKNGGVPLPDGSTAPQGFSFKSEFNLFGLSFYGAMNYVSGKQLNGTFQYDGKLSWGNGAFILSGSESKPIELYTDRNNSSIPKNQNELPSAKESKTTVCKGGGVLFTFSAEQYTIPTLKANGTATFLGVASESITIEIESNFLEFNFSFDAGVEINNQFRLSNKQLSGSITFGLDKNIELKADYCSVGSMNSSNKVTADIMISESNFIAQIGFAFNGFTFNFGSHDFSSCNSISEFIAQACTVVADNAATIAAEVLNNPNAWVNAIQNGDLSFLEEGGGTAMAAILALHHLGVPYTAEIGKYLGEVQNQLKYTVSDVQNAVKTIGYDVVPYASKVIPGAILASVGQTLESVNIKELEQDPAKFFNSFSSYMPSNVAQFMQNELSSVEMDVAKAFNMAGISPKDTASALKEVYHITVEDAKSLVEEAGGEFMKGLNNFEGFMKHVGSFLGL